MKSSSVLLSPKMSWSSSFLLTAAAGAVMLVFVGGSKCTTSAAGNVQWQRARLVLPSFLLVQRRRTELLVRGGGEEQEQDEQYPNNYYNPLQAPASSSSSSSSSSSDAQPRGYSNPQQRALYDMEEDDDSSTLRMSEDVPFTETEQDRVERWKTQQREQAMAAVQQQYYQEQQQYTSGSSGATTAASASAATTAPTTLLATVSRGSRVVIFFFLMWRDIALFEMADQAILNNGPLRILLVTPLVFLFVANMAGALASLVSSSSTQSHATKRRLKAILNADKLVELSLIPFYILRLTIWPSKYTPREIYIANIFHSVLFLLQCQAFTRVSWDDTTKHQTQQHPYHEALDNDNYNEMNDTYQPQPYPDGKKQSFTQQQYQPEYSRYQ